MGIVGVVIVGGVTVGAVGDETPGAPHAEQMHMTDAEIIIDVVRIKRLETCKTFLHKFKALCKFVYCFC